MSDRILTDAIRNHREVYIPDGSALPESTLLAANHGTGVEQDLKQWLESVFNSGDAPGHALFIHDGRGRALPVREWWIGPEGDIHIEVIS